jgi:predicted molibdopterin-dependent oxidoreductase YjgC
VSKTDSGDMKSRSNLGGGIARGREINLHVDGLDVPAYTGETVAAAMMAAGIRGFRRSTRGGARGVYCGIGVCFECLVRVNGQPNLRACITYAEDGMTIDRPNWRPATEGSPAGEQP